MRALFTENPGGFKSPVLKNRQKYAEKNTQKYMIEIEAIKNCVIV